MTYVTAVASSVGSPLWLQVLQALPSLLWPALIFGLILLFRKQIKEKIPGLQSFKTIQFEATFVAQLGDLSQENARASGSDRRDAVGRALRAKRYCAGQHILWVDDNPGNNRDLGQFFSDLIDVHIDYVLSTEEAMETLRHRGDYSIVITDMARGTNRNAGNDLIRAAKKENLSLPTVIYGSRDSSTDGVPPGAFGLTNRPDLLLHYIIDICERDNGTLRGR
jgi:CheY-like chemotaxis protein